MSFTLLAPTKIDNGSIKLQLCFKMDKDEVRIDGFSFIEVVELAIGVIVIPCRERSSKGWATSSGRWVPSGSTCRKESPNLIRNKRKEKYGKKKERRYWDKMKNCVKRELVNQQITQKMLSKLNIFFMLFFITFVRISSYCIGWIYNGYIFICLSSI